MNQSVCVLFQDDHAHPAHQTFGDAVGAEYRHFETGRPPTSDNRNQNTDDEIDRFYTGLQISDEYDIVIAEGTAPLQTLLTYSVLKNRRATCLYLAADETFLTLDQRSSRWIWGSLLGPMAGQIIDGCIAVGQDVYDWATPYIGDVPAKIVHPPIEDCKYELLSNLDVRSPKDKFTVLSVGVDKPANNFDILAQAGRKLRQEKGTHVQTVLLGAGHEDREYAEYDGIITPGYVPLDAFQSWFSRASVYVQPSTGDSYPVASLEGMLSGTPTVVTTKVGTRHRLPENHVVEPTERGLLGAIRSLHDSNEEERLRRGREHRESVRGLTESAQRAAFREAVTDIWEKSR